MKLNDLIQYPQSERTRKKINEILQPIFENNIKNKKQKFYEKITAKLENSSNENTGTRKKHIVLWALKILKKWKLQKKRLRNF